jgi:long-chain acyl-CoA synthetase
MTPLELRLRDALANVRTRLHREDKPQRLQAEPLHPAGYADLGSLLYDACLEFRELTACIEMDRKRTRETLTYADVLAEASRLARRFEVLGWGKGDRLAIIMSNQPAWLISAMAAFLRGMVVVPVDMKLSGEEQAALLRHSNPKGLITESHFWTKLFGASEKPTAWGQGLPSGLITFVTEWNLPLADGLLRWEDQSDGTPPTRIPRTRDDLACIVYSSGTGGRPKGCQLTHDNYLFQLESLVELYPMRPGVDRWFSVLPTNHAIDFMCGFIGVFASGATVVHQRTLRPEFLIDTLKTQKITQMAVVPLLLEAFERALDNNLRDIPSWQKSALDALTSLNAALTDKRPNHALSKLLMKPIHDGFGGHLRYLFAGGAFVDARRAERFAKLGLPVVIGYGLTECSTVATVQDLAPFRADTVGRPVRGVEVKIVDAGPDGIGEVWIRGRTVMQGYLDDPELTASTLVDDPDGKGRWLKTGDLGKLDAANHLKLVGRKKNMIVTAGGKNVYPEDLEVAFTNVGAEDLVIFAEYFVWPKPTAEDNATLVDTLTHERLVVVAHGKDWERIARKIGDANKKQPEARRVHASVRCPVPFPRTASMKVKREELAELLRTRVNRSEIKNL